MAFASSRHYPFIRLSPKELDELKLGAEHRTLHEYIILYKRGRSCYGEKDRSVASMNKARSPRDLFIGVLCNYYRSHLHFTTRIQNTAFYQTNGIQCERIHKNFSVMCVWMPIPSAGGSAGALLTSLGQTDSHAIARP